MHKFSELKVCKKVLDFTKNEFLSASSCSEILANENELWQHSAILIRNE